jgi:hypothetical protein
MVVEGILEESRAFYQTQYDQIVGRLIHVPKGSLRRQTHARRSYWYLRRHISGKGYVDAYIGQAGNKEVESCLGFIRERRKRLEDLRNIKNSLGLLGVRKVELKERAYPQILLELFETFGRANLWEEGLALIGSWCFSVYNQVFEVDFYPIRTLDFDFGLRIPYSGQKTDVDQMIRNLGFMPRIDRGYDKIDYELPGVGVVEVFIDAEKVSEAEKRVLRQQLNIRPAALSYLHFLVAHTVSAKIHGIHKNVTVPSLPAFFIHRLVTARFGEYRRGPYHDAAIIRKDLKQAALVAKKIVFDRNLKAQAAALMRELDEEMREKMHQGADGATEYVKAPDLTEEDVGYILKLARSEWFH